MAVESIAIEGYIYHCFGFFYWLTSLPWSDSLKLGHKFVIIDTTNLEMSWNLRAV